MGFAAFGVTLSFVFYFNNSCILMPLQDPLFLWRAAAQQLHNPPPLSSGAGGVVCFLSGPLVLEGPTQPGAGQLPHAHRLLLEGASWEH